MYVLTYRVLLDPDGRSKFDDLSKWGLIKLLYHASKFRENKTLAKITEFTVSFVDKGLI